MPGHMFTPHWLLVVPMLACAGACSGGRDTTLEGYTKIDDMEGERDLLQWTSPGSVPGSWWSSTDCTEGQNISPLPYFLDLTGWSYAALPQPHDTFPGIVSTHAARLQTTQPLAGIWGANMGFDFSPLSSSDGDPAQPPGGADAGVPADGQPCRQGSALDTPARPVDLSAYSGFTFWAMAATPGARIIRVQFNDSHTDPRAGVCNAADPRGNGDCYNGFGVALLLTDTFTQYTVDFASLQQQPVWGYRPDPDVPDLQNIYTMNFEVDLPDCLLGPNAVCAGGPPSLVFDLWVDDLYFVNK